MANSHNKCEVYSIPPLETICLNTAGKTVAFEMALQKRLSKDVKKWKLLGFLCLRVFEGFQNGLDYSFRILEYFVCKKIWKSKTQIHYFIYILTINNWIFYDSSVWSHTTLLCPLIIQFDLNIFPPSMCWMSVAADFAFLALLPAVFMERCV